MFPSTYIHIPFCRKKCFFCSFAVAVGQASRFDEYLAALGREVACYSGRKIGTIYIGGGTPSCLEAGQITELRRLIGASFQFSDEAEITFEANPESLDEEKAAALQVAGINRVSLGIQSMDDARLEFLGRAHRKDDAVRAFGVLRSAGFRNINVDLMYGFPGQSEEELSRDLDAVLAFKSEHISIYSLTVEERSLFFARKVGLDGDAQASAYELIRRRLADAGYRQYEVSNFARPGFESEHNLNYWRGGEYIGLGMAAHSHLDGRRFWNIDTLPLYLGMMAERGDALAGEERLTGIEKLMEIFLFGLRMNEGVDLGSLERRMGVELPLEKREAIESFMEMGLLEEAVDRIRATDRGRLVLDEISARLV
jgi:oxygen-independent coproporphyrinogen-3 oxidase